MLEQSAAGIFFTFIISNERYNRRICIRRRYRPKNSRSCQVRLSLAQIIPPAATVCFLRCGRCLVRVRNEVAGQCARWLRYGHPSLCPTASHVYNLMDALRASSMVVSALPRKHPPRLPRNQNLAKSATKRKGELTAVTMIRRYNRFWTQEDDQLLLELRAAGRSSIIIAAALHRSPQAIEKRLFTLRARLQFAEVVAIPSEKKAEA